MKTEVVMKRELFGMPISQKSQSEFFSATDLVKAGNKWRMANDLGVFNLSQWLKTQNTKDFTSELEKKYGTAMVVGRGRSAHTWVHPLLFIDMALAISPKLKIEVYEWLFDHLIKFRNDSGDSYKEMAGALYTRCGNHKEFPTLIKNVAQAIKAACGVKDWQTATQEQLKKRDNIHNAMKLFSKVLTNPEDILRLSIEEYK